MRRKLAALALVVVVAVGAGGCTGSGPGVAEPATPAQTAEEAPTQSQAPSDDGVDGSTDPTVEPTEPLVMPEDLEEELAGLDLNDRGFVDVEAELPAEFEDIVTGTLYATITAKEIQTDFECTEPDAYEPINGQYVAIRYEVDLTRDFAASGFGDLLFSVHEFRAWDEEGEAIVDPVGNAESCIPASERVLTPLKPGEKESGLVVFDVPTGPGSASFVPGGYQGSFGWEWSW